MARRTERPAPDPRRTEAHREASVLVYRAMGRVIAGRREAARLSLRELTAKCDVGAGFISDIEHGRGNATWNTLSAICEGLGTTFVDVLSESCVLAEQTYDAEKGA